MAEAKGSKKYSVAGEGSYGIVIKPALPNNGKEFPTNVTKIFKYEDEYEKAIKNTNIIKHIKGLNASVMNYTQKRKVKNLPINIKNNVKHFINSINNADDLFMIRQKNLGISIHNIQNNPEMYNMVRKMPYQKICQEIYKCMNVVKSIYDSGYVHGDIRQTNVLFNFDTSELNIIDFDWLMPFNEFKIKYPTYSVYHPPECVALYGMHYTKPEYSKLKIMIKMGLSSEKDIKNIYDDFNEEPPMYDSEKIAEAMYDFYKEDKINKTIASTLYTLFDKYESEDIISRKNVSGSIDLSRIIDVYDKLFNIAKKYIDSYGLGLSINGLLFNAWGETTPITLKDKDYGGTTTDKEFNNFNKMRLFILGELAPKMTSSDFNKRWDINQAIEALSTKMRELGIEVPIIGGDEIASRITDGAVAAGGAGAVALTHMSSNRSKIVAPKSPQKPAEIADAVSKVIAHIETATNTKGGYKRGRANKKFRKTIKRNRK
jgi:serine/threonine protein kinase